MREQKKSGNRNSHDQQLAQLKIPPHSIEAEQAVLGGLMLNNDAWEQVNEILSEQDFYQPQHRSIYAVLSNLAQKNQPFDVLTVSETLKSVDQADAVDHVFTMVKNTPSAANIIAYAEIVRERSILRQLIQTGTQIIEEVYTNTGRAVRDLLDEAERSVFRIAEQQKTRGTSPIHIQPLLTKAIEHVDALSHAKGSIIGLATGYKDLDEQTLGLHAADLVVIAGRPSMGKTTFAMNIAEHAAIRSKKAVLVFSMEMPGEALAIRMLSSLGRIDQQKVRRGDLDDADWFRIQGALNLLSETRLFIDDTPALTPQEMRTRARRLCREEGQLGLIVVDYLQLMQMPGFKENRTAEISEISRSLKTLAKELNVPLIALSQLNRGLEQRADKRPVMSDLRESGAIEQDADLILFIYRDEVYNRDSKDKGKAEIIIAKQRNGPIGKIDLTFLGKHTRFENYSPEGFIQEHYVS